MTNPKKPKNPSASESATSEGKRVSEVIPGTTAWSNRSPATRNAEELMTERYRAERVWFEGETLCVKTVQGPKFEFSNAYTKLLTSVLRETSLSSNLRLAREMAREAADREVAKAVKKLPLLHFDEIDDLDRAAEEFRRDLVKNAKPIPGLHCAECGEEVYNAFHPDSVHKGVICKNLHAGQGEPDVNFTYDDEDPAIPGFFREEQPTLPEGRARKNDCPECGGTGYVTTGVQCPCVRRRRGRVQERIVEMVEYRDAASIEPVVVERCGKCHSVLCRGDCEDETEAVLKRAWENVDDGEDENDPFEPSPLPPDTQKKT